MEEGSQVVAVTRSRERAAELQKSGIVPLVADVTDRSSLTNLPAADTVLYAVGYDRNSPHSIEEVYAGGVRNVLAALGHVPRRFVYVSTTGVYGDAAGKWIDEATPPAPQRAGGRASLAAEESLRASPLAARGVVLRMGGLYGPGRIPYAEKLRDGQPIPAPDEGWLNLIHIDDAAAVVLAAADSAGLLAEAMVLNGVDTEPVRRADYYREVARLIGAAPPKFAPPDPTSHRAARAGANRRISSARLHAVLDVPLMYPTYREGLNAILTHS
jgi:nucleoside-diphosphate-sugar epimerase